MPHRGLTLVELVVALSLMSILLFGLSSVLMLSTRSLESAGSLIVESEARGVLERIDADARLATCVLQQSDTALTIVVPDRDVPPDDIDETIRYAWLGSPGSPGPLVRAYNGGEEMVVLGEVHDFAISTVDRTVTGTNTGGAIVAPDPDTWGYFATPVPGGPEPDWLAAGRYVGDGADDRVIPVGFEPALVIIKGESSGEAVIRSSTVAGDGAKSMTSSATLLSNRIQSLDAIGFTIGSASQVNRNSESFVWVAFREVAGLMHVGSYAGDGSDDRSISGVGFEPDYVIVFGENDKQVWQRSSPMTGDVSYPFIGDRASDHIQAFETDGFQVGGNADVNDADVIYHYACWKAAVNQMAVGAHVGDDNDGRHIADPDFRPDYVIVKQDSGERAVHRSVSVSGADATLEFVNSASFENGVQSLFGSGFELGTNKRVNKSGIAHYWSAFTARTTPIDLENFIEAHLPSDGQQLKISAPAGTGEGDLLIAAVVTDGDETLVPPAGWTEIDVGAGAGSLTLGVWWKLAAAAESGDYIFTWSSKEQAYGWIMRFTGHDGVAPIVDANVLDDISATPPCGSVDTLVDGSVVLCIGGFDDDDVSVDAPGITGYTAITMDSSAAIGGTCSGGAAYIIQGTPGTIQPPSFVLTGSEEYRMVTIAIAPRP